MDTASSKYILRCSQAPLIQFSLSKPITILGRAPECDIVLDDRSVSRRHAEFRIGESGLEIADLGSKCGTFVAEKRIQTCKVDYGDRIRIGTISLVLVASQNFPVMMETESPSVCIKNSSNGQKDPYNISLSPAKARVLNLLLKGHQQKAIAQQLGLSPNTVHHHTQSIYRAYNVNSCLELMALFSQRLGHVHTDST
jgi:DNA-binding CsgD family transcriptional regulator